MNKNRSFKLFAVLNFVVLIVVFLLYRNGTFDSKTPEPKRKTEQLSKKKLEQTKSEKKDIAKDTEPVEDDSKSPMTNEGKEAEKFDQMMYSSKSAIVVDPVNYHPTVEVTEEKIPTIMPSSKSGVVFSPKGKDTVKKNP